MDGKAQEKIYFSIGEVSTMLGVPQHVLRYWEDAFPSLKPPKRRTGSRAYRQRDIEKLRLIKRLLHDEGYTIRGARKRLREGVLRADEGDGIRSLSKELVDIENGLQKIIEILDADK